MKILHSISSFVAGIAMMVILLITSFEIGAYSDFGWYEKEYIKYDVLIDLEMEIEDVMEVTKEMMAYLRGNREDLVVETVVDKEEREFFNDREKAHMVDVKDLFIGGLWLRRGALALLIAVIFVLVKTRADWKRLLPKSFLIAMGTFIGITAFAGVLFVSDFNRYFTLFHELFFDNDLWLLDPRTDLLIRMLPEGFFLDMVVRIGVIFLLLMVIVAVGSVGLIIMDKKRKKCTNEDKCVMIEEIR